MTAPAGWYPDAHGVLRWWDGYRWTDAAPGPPVLAPAPRVASGTPTNTAWIWLVVVAQAAIFAFAAVALVQVQPQVQAYLSAFRSAPDGSTAIVFQRQAAMFGNPWYIANVIFPFVACAAAVWFAYLDRKALQNRGYVRPFHWAWAILGVFMYACSLVYTIGRTVVVRRRGGQGSAPMVVSIVIQAVGLAAVAIADFWILGALVTH